MQPDADMHSILVVDDSEFFRNELIEFLSSQKGWKVVGEAKNGADAILLVKTLQPDLVLMDIHMPVMDGLEATTFIKKQLNRRIKVVFLSLHDSATGGELSSQFLGDGYIAKQGIKRELPRVLKQVGVALGDQ